MPLARVVMVLVVALVAAAVQKGVDVQVNLKQGVFKGEPLDAGDGRQVYSFRGIPYAKPPVGTLRFKEPEPVDAWQGTKESFSPPQCPQMDIEKMLKGEDPQVKGEEDCLYLHVYTPKLCGGAVLPVMVFLHGGGFMFGNSEMYGGAPLPLLTKDVVLVSLQYRLGTLGFLSTGDSFLPGNMGLKDQTLALRWVRDNIRSFGGNPDSVTIFGESAGGASVHMQMLTPKSEGLFHRAIMQSGSALCPWAMRNDHKEVAAGVARQLGCPGVETPDGSLNGETLLSCLQAASVEDLIMAGTQGEVWSYFPFYMVPRVDGDYFPAHPATLMREGRYHKVDVISGVCQHEGFMTAINAVETPAGKQLLESFPTLAPISVGVDEEERPFYLARRIYYHYLGAGNITISEKNVDELVEMYGNIFFAVAQDLTVQYLTWDVGYGKNVYMYQLEHLGDSKLSDMMNISLEMKWVGHGDDLVFLFNEVFGSKPLKRPDDVFLREIIVDLWTTFAASGNPTPDLTLGFQWTPATASSLHYLSLQPAPVMRPDPRVKIRAFHNDLPTEENMLLFPKKFPSKTVGQEDGSESEHCHV
ncbi:hypothetical protein O3P69_014903 [Scylla paramamosain]|uniref:Carboxylic ester hydrolase n=1 Tax=Scylla paramamosain TaxID=85552 RepID=A0AAW0TZV4_SCYPA